MKLWEDKKTINYIRKLSGEERLKKAFELTKLSYEILKRGVADRFKGKDRNKILKKILNLHCNI